ncbi:hypothetical protein HZH66_014908 [Vespula vulgaris]|uniref:Uncharacterized protein n=1 Tax=Vespula vulgaris TaxID=7454 RepID=A0A834J0G0_VESVU|nr:hypothetical protein HZH66_014908 [Vespula vulgaris]
MGETRLEGGPKQDDPGCTREGCLQGVSREEERKDEEVLGLALREEEEKEEEEEKDKKRKKGKEKEKEKERMKRHETEWRRGERGAGGGGERRRLESRKCGTLRNGRGCKETGGPKGATTVESRGINPYPQLPFVLGVAWSTC